MKKKKQFKEKIPYKQPRPQNHLTSPAQMVQCAIILSEIILYFGFHYQKADW